jgi:transposase
MPAIKACIIEPIWAQFSDLLPDHQDNHPWGCHRPRIPDRLVFDKLVQVLVFGCAYERIADATCSATTLRRRRDEWITAGVMDRLDAMVLAAYDHMIGLGLADIAVDGCITKAPGGGEVAGRSPVDRGKPGLKRSMVVDAQGIPLGASSGESWQFAGAAMAPTLDTLEGLDPLPDAMTVHLDRGHDSSVTRERLADRGLQGEIAQKGQPAPVTAGKRWVVERTNAWINAYKKLVWCTERRGRVVEFWVSFVAVIVIVGRLIRQAWTRYRWDGRPVRKP